MLVIAPQSTIGVPDTILALASQDYASVKGQSVIPLKDGGQLVDGAKIAIRLRDNIEVPVALIGRPRAHSAPQRRLGHGGGADGVSGSEDDD